MSKGLTEDYISNSQNYPFFSNLKIAGFAKIREPYSEAALASSI
jgi:hypothetical protein